MTVLARTADRPDDYRRLDLQPGLVVPREDGMRTDGSRGSYEWWYFDAHLDDGSSLVITFFTKESLATWTGLRPRASAELERPGEPKRTWTVKAGPEDFAASTAECDVRIKGSTFRGSDSSYAIHFEDEGVAIDIELTGQVPAWRPETGHFYFGEHDRHLFAWLPAVPQGTVRARIVENGRTSELTGTGYHDHNWGDATMMRLMNHWYWGRAQAGPYSVIASRLVAAKRYDYAEIPIFMLAKDGQVVVDDAERVNLRVEDVFIDEVSKKPIANRVIYEYAGDADSYRVTFQREKTIHTVLPSDVDSVAVRALVKVARIEGAYLRFTGTVTVERLVDGSVVESEQDTGIWEVTYFARPVPGRR